MNGIITYTKRALQTTLFFSLFALLLTSCEEPNRKVKIGELYYLLDDDKLTAQVIETQSYNSGSNYSGMETVIIPDIVDYNEKTYTVTAIAKYAFFQCPNLKSVTLPNSITNIGMCAFAYCHGLTSIEFSYSVKHLDDHAFYNCAGLTSVVIPNNIKSIGNWTFGDCSALTSITIGDGLSELAPEAFAGCPNVVSVVIDKQNAKYDSRYDCNAIIEKYTNRLVYGCRNTIIPSDVVRIEGHAFEGCNKLDSIAIPNSVTSIGNDAFEGCTELKAINMHDDIIEIESGAFRNCTALTSVTLSKRLTKISDGLFSGCTALESVDIPNGVTQIGYGAFNECKSMKSIYLPDGITEIEPAAFEYCSGLTSVSLPKAITVINDVTFHGCSALESVVIPEFVERIDACAFGDCSSLKSVTCYAVAPPKMCRVVYHESDEGKEVFNGIDYKNATLHVPAESIEAYRASKQWGKFGSIQPLN